MKIYEIYYDNPQIDPVTVQADIYEMFAELLTQSGIHPSEIFSEQIGEYPIQGRVYLVLT